MKNENKFSEVQKALDGISAIKNNKDLLDNVMQVLDSQRLLHYSSGEEVSLFSTAGRILYTLMQEPAMTHRALAVYLDLSENMIERTVKTLISQGLITKTKVERKNVYSFNIDELKKHPDIRRLETIITMINGLEEVGEEEPF
jgi:predicted HTH transcriptional regulator